MPTFYSFPQLAYVFRSVLVLVLCAGVALPVSPRAALAAGSTIVVNSAADTSAGDGLCTLREAIANANGNSQSGSADCAAGAASDTITFAGDYTIILTALLPSLTDALTIDAAGRSVTISGNNAWQIFAIPSGTQVALNNLHLKNGKRSTSGGAIGNAGALTIGNSSFSQNTGGPGGAIYSTGALTVTGSIFSSNQASSAGGAIWGQDAGKLSIAASTFSGNHAPGGGAIYLVGDTSLDLATSTFSANTANNGGALRIDNGTTVSVSNSTFSGNTGSTSGGAINIVNGATVAVSSSTLSGNTALPPSAVNNGGGGIYNGGTLHLRNTIIADSVGGGGDCKNQGSLATNVKNLVEDGSCSAAFSGDPKLEPLQNNGGPTLTQYLLPGSPAINAGDNTGAPATDQRGFARILNGTIDLGAVEVDPAACRPSLAVSVASDSGAGSLRQALVDVCSGGTIDFAPALDNQTIALTSAELAVSKTVTITNSHALNLQISGNNARRVFVVQAGGALAISGLTITGGKASGGNGGAISNAGALSLRDSTISASSAGTGGAIYTGGALTIVNSTLSGNSATAAGGALQIAAGATATIASSTFSANAAPAGGAINNGGTLQLRNNIIANSSGGDCANTGALAANVKNLVEDGSCSAAFSGDPKLAPLQNNGGPTLTHEPLPGSAAIDAGDNAGAPATDQRGFARILNGTIDLGAVETTAVPQVQFAQSSYSLPESGGASTIVTLTRTGALGTAAQVQVAIGGGTATAGVDYSSAGFPLTVTFGPGVTSQAITITPIADAQAEPNETIVLQLSSIGSTLLGTPASTTISILDAAQTTNHSVFIPLIRK